MAETRSVAWTAPVRYAAVLMPCQRSLSPARPASVEVLSCDEDGSVSAERRELEDVAALSWVMVTARARSPVGDVGGRLREL